MLNQPSFDFDYDTPAPLKPGSQPVSQPESQPAPAPLSSQSDPQAPSEGAGVVSLASGKPSLLLIDGNSLAYRAFHALPESFTDPEGNPTGAVYGFSTMLISLLGAKPDKVGVCWDTPGPTFRHELDPDYKAGRAATPDSLPAQLADIRRVVDAFGIAQCEDTHYEADDLVATLARAGADAGHQVVVVTGDRDCFQLASDDVTVWWTRRGVSDVVHVTPEWVRGRYGVSPAQYRELAALRGDTSDNLPGVPGVGEKTASRLLATYGSIDGIYANLSELTPKLRANLEAHRDRVALNLGMTILCDTVPSVPSLTETVWQLGSLEPVGALFSRFGFTSVWNRVLALS